MADDILTQLQSISLIESQHLKLEKVKQIHQHIKQIGEQNTFSEINFELCKEFHIRIVEGKSEVEKALLEVLNSLAEIGAETVHQYQNNQFFQIFDKSGLINKILNILNNETDNNKQIIEDNSLIFIIHTFQTYGFINKHKYIDEELCMKCGYILRSQITNLIKKIKEQSQQININKIDDNINNEIRDGIKSLNAIQFLSEDDDNNDVFFDLKIHEAISPLIHLNCQNYLICPQNFTFPDSSLIQDLQGAAFRTIGELIWINKSAIQQLLKNHSILDHIIPVIISFVQHHSNQTQITFIYHSYSSTSNSFDQQYNSHSIIDGTLRLLLFILKDDELVSQQTSVIPDLLPSLIELTKYQKIRKERMNIDIQNAEIRLDSNYCLLHILKFSSEQMKIRIINEYGLIKALIEEVGNCGGMKEEDNTVIQQSLLNIKLIFRQLIQGSDQHPSLKDLTNLSTEQIELEGGIEEIEANQYHEQYDMSFQMNYSSKETCNQMNNIYKDLTN